MRTLSLFSGIGGLDLGLERAGFQIVAQCEADPFCRAVLAKHWPGVPCHDDVRTINPEAVGPVECVCGGFPCQDVSVAGKGVGVDAGARSGLWREMLRVITALRPGWVIAENVPALRTRGADRVLGDLERLGYTVTPIVVGAEHVGAPHRRHRVFVVGCLADSSSEREMRLPVRSGGPLQAARNPDGASKGLADAHNVGCHPPERPAARAGEPVIDGYGQLGHPESTRLEGQRADAGQPQQSEPRHAGLGNAHVGGRRQHEQGRGEEGRASTGWAGKAVEYTVGVGVGRNTGAAPGTQEASDRQGSQHGPCGHRVAEPSSNAMRWPSGPGQPQHDWEAPRLAQFPVGTSTDGLSSRLVRFGNRSALKAAGNAVVPQVAELVGRAVMASMEAAE